MDKVSPLAILVDGDIVESAIIYRGSNIVDFYPYDIDVVENIELLSLYVSDKLTPYSDYMVLKTGDRYILVLPLPNRISLVLFFCNKINIHDVQKYYEYLRDTIEILLHQNQIMENIYLY